MDCGLCQNIPVCKFKTEEGKTETTCPQDCSARLWGKGQVQTYIAHEAAHTVTILHVQCRRFTV